MATDTLFEQHSVKEIQDIEKKLRNDIERKKEELRQMVGERYRDLMEAADTITEMKQTAENITLRISSMEKNCSQLEQSSLKSGIIQNVKLKVAQRKKKNENLYTIAALIKILMDAPAQIWGYVEFEDYISALQLYVLARHTHAVLVLDPFYRKQGILSQFPIISKQWTSIRHFQHILLQKSKDVMLLEKIYAEQLVGPLCCLIFLSDTPIEQVLEEVLSTRKIAVKRIFRPEKSAKTQVCELVEVLQDTMKIIHSLFYPGISTSNDCQSNLLQNTIDQITSKDSLGPVSLLDANGPTFQYLPKDITTYRPSLNTSFNALSMEYLQNMCNKWLSELNAELQPTVRDLLNYVGTVKGLALIREAVIDKLQEEPHWDGICSHILDHEFSVWNFFLHDIFMERTKEIIKNQIEFSASECMSGVEEIFKGFKNKHTEENVSSYIWTESESDLAPNLGWITHHQRQLWEGGTLGIKAYALTPNVQSLCVSLDRKLDNLLEDMSHLHLGEKLQEEQWEKRQEMECLEQTRVKASYPSADIKSIYSHLTDVSQKCFFNLADQFEKILHSSSNDCNKRVPSELVFLGHLCHGLTKLCPHFAQCFVQENRETLSRSLSLGTMSMNKGDNLWQSLKSRFLQLSDDAFRIWSKQKIDELVTKFDNELVVCSGTGILKALLQWDKVEIQEESEEGNVVKSVLRIPQQVSVPLYNSLFLFCWEMNKIGGYTLSSRVRTELQENYFLHLMLIYQKKVDAQWPEDVFNAHLAQTQSLQFFFDVQFLMGLMGITGKSDDEASLLSKDILAKIVASIDPFDMDVFSSHIQTNLRQGIQRSLLLLGLAVSSDQINHLKSLKTLPPSGQIEHSLMLMPSSSSRLPLLPFASRTTTAVSSIQDSTRNIVSISQGSPLKTSRSHNSSPNLNTSDNIANILKSSSFYDRVTAMSSSWFGSN